MAKTTPPTTPESSGSARPVARPRAAAAEAAKGRVSAPSVGNYFAESRAELRKVTWPTRQEATNLTTAVLGMTIGLSIFLGVIDAGLDKIVSYVLNGG